MLYYMTKKDNDVHAINILTYVYEDICDFNSHSLHNAKFILIRERNARHVARHFRILPA